MTIENKGICAVGIAFGTSSVAFIIFMLSFV